MILETFQSYTAHCIRLVEIFVGVRFFPFNFRGERLICFLCFFIFCLYLALLKYQYFTFVNSVFFSFLIFSVFMSFPIEFDNKLVVYSFAVAIECPLSKL